jgi:hypothetical protein
MVFNVTELDKVLLLQALYSHASPKGVGRIEHSVRAARGENVVGLTDEECEMILSMDHPDATTLLVDYYNGKPIKLDFEHQRNGQDLVCSDGYDSRNGRYRFLEALLNVFDPDEIIIVKKGYPIHLKEMIDEHTVIPIEELAVLKNLMKRTVKHTDNGVYWKIDTTAVDYKPPFMRGI